MDQNSNTTKPLNIAFIKAKWHDTIVDQCYAYCEKTLKSETNDTCKVKLFTVPGALEIPLLAQDIAKTGKYDAIIASAFIVDGGIYRHDFVSTTVLDAMMRVQLDTGVPVFSAVLTPHHYQDTDTHNAYFFDHFQHKGVEAAHACLEMLAVRRTVLEAA
ncbi:MAG: riboflavin synthase subunit beta [Robiginitomaculum sp.]|nr:MAG: riboflavin synthase subunit beta [Robiginitomaculum sp.]